MAILGRYLLAWSGTVYLCKVEGSPWVPSSPPICCVAGGGEGQTDKPHLVGCYGWEGRAQEGKQLQPPIKSAQSPCL